jgi:hypothetical protein
MSKMLGTMDKMLNRIDEHKKGLIKWNSPTTSTLSS